MNDEEAAVAAAAIAAEAQVAEAQIAAQAQVAATAQEQSGETDRAQLIAQAMQMRDDDRAQIAALVTQLAELRAQVEGLTLATAVAVEQVSEQAAEAQATAEEAAASEAGAIPELETAEAQAPTAGGGPVAESETPPAGDTPRPATARIGSRHATRHQRAHAQRFGR